MFGCLFVEVLCVCGGFLFVFLWFYVFVEVFCLFFCGFVEVFCGGFLFVKVFCLFFCGFVCL